MQRRELVIVRNEELKESAGFNKEELIEYIRKKTPVFVKTIVEEKDNFFDIKLIWNPNFWIEGGIPKDKVSRNYL